MVGFSKLLIILIVPTRNKKATSTTMNFILLKKKNMKKKKEKKKRNRRKLRTPAITITRTTTKTSWTTRILTTPPMRMPTLTRTMSIIMIRTTLIILTLNYGQTISKFKTKNSCSVNSYCPTINANFSKILKYFN